MCKIYNVSYIFLNLCSWWHDQIPMQIFCLMFVIELSLLVISRASIKISSQTIFLSLLHVKPTHWIWPQILSTGFGRACVCMTILHFRRQCGVQAPSAVSTSWTPGLLGPPTLGSTDGGKWISGFCYAQLTVKLAENLKCYECSL